MNKEVRTLEVPEEIFGVKWNSDLVHQVITSLRGNRRVPVAHTKDRGEVSGGGKKPWRQKGTGRARHGSTRSPIWVGGGVAFGPTKERNFEKKVNKKMKKGALYSVLSQKVREGEVVLVDDFGATRPKTKEVVSMLQALETKKNTSRTLLVAKEGNANAALSGRNIPKIAVVYPSGLNAENCLDARRVIFEEKAMEEFIEKNKK